MMHVTTGSSLEIVAKPTLRVLELPQRISTSRHITCGCMGLIRQRKVVSEALERSETKISDRGKTYIASFGTAATDFYFEAHNLWVYGFDSATEGSIGGSGKIRDEDLRSWQNLHCEFWNCRNGFLLRGT